MSASNLPRDACRSTRPRRVVAVTDWQLDMSGVFEVVTFADDSEERYYPTLARTAAASES